MRRPSIRELHSLAEFDEHVAARRGLDGVVVQGVDLSGRTDVLLRTTCTGATFLGANLTDAALRHVHDEGAVVFPRLPDLPFDPYRPRLYDQAELLDGWRPGGDFGLARDSLIHRWADQHPRGTHLPVIDALARRLHDHAIDDALRDHLDHHPDVVAVMGGHGLTRDDPTYAAITSLGRSLARAGLHLATGGGPGAMEAANLGAWLAPHPEDAVADALQTLTQAPHFEETDHYLTAGARVVAAHPEGGSSLAIPTWFYGHEPTNQFASHIAKYFANSIREDGLLAIAQRGVVFAPGSAGTVQEIFQDATQNHYEVFDTVSPMVLFGADYWTNTLPALPLLRELAGERRYAPLVAVADTAEEVVALIVDAVG